ncbi:hypothetical protein LCGC14_1692620 [marine sediment metagenome]|uniref:Uncharacterized protein n=1 Tax=marine sediment metagenome TaxID=412755 RepID=A0A0F9KKF7_9ZZZZ
MATHRAKAQGAGHMKTNGHGISIATAVVLAVAMGAAFIAYGAQGEKVDGNKERIVKLENAQTKIHEINRGQVQLQEQVRGLTREQRTFREDTNKSLDRILKKLDE